MKSTGKLFRDEDGMQTAEEALLLVLIVVACYLVLQALGTDISTLYSSVITDI